VTGDGVVGDTEAALFVRLMEPHVNPRSCCVHVLYASRVPFLRRALASPPGVVGGSVACVCVITLWETPAIIRNCQK